MGLLDSVRRAEEQGREAARRGLEREQLREERERRLRRRMRIHPSPSAVLPNSSTSLRNPPRASGGIRP